MLYSCAGGIGATKEKYLIKVHSFLKHKSCASILESVFAENFKNGFSRTRYLRLREIFNNRKEKLGSLVNCAELFLLWSCSGFTHRYRSLGYDGPYCPTPIDYEQVRKISQLNRDKNILFRNENYKNPSEFLINDNVFLYFYLPLTLGTYGPGYRWSRDVAKETISKIFEFHSKGYKICVCTQTQSRGAKILQYIDSLSFLSTTYTMQFKDLDCSSDTYLLNF